MMSRFAKQLSGTPSGFDFVAAHFRCEEDRFSDDNANGYVNFGSAQNFLHNEKLQQQLDENLWIEAEARYQSFRGTYDCRLSIAGYLESISGASIDWEQIVVGNGIISLLESLALALLDEGDSVLVPTPVFPGLVNAITLRTNARVSYVPLGPENDFRLSPTAIDAALTREAAAGHCVKAVLLCSPGNPVGQVFTAKEIAAFTEIAREHNCALIVDEVYASSCFEGVDFTSALTFQDKHVFVLGGLSKDFGLAGYATGWLHGTHPQVMAAVAKQAHFFRLPTPIQRNIQTVLEPEWRTKFIAVNRRLLSRQYRETRQHLEALGVGVSTAEAGLCLWLDLSDFLTSQDAAGQMHLYQELLEEYRVHISPGSGFHCQLPRYFRICFSQDIRALHEGLQRIETGLRNISKTNPLAISMEKTLS